MSTKVEWYIQNSGSCLVGYVQEEALDVFRRLLGDYMVRSFQSDFLSGNVGRFRVDLLPGKNGLFITELEGPPRGTVITGTLDDLYPHMNDYRGETPLTQPRAERILSYATFFNLSTWRDLSAFREESKCYLNERDIKQNPRLEKHLEKLLAVATIILGKPQAVDDLKRIAQTVKAGLDF